MSACFTGSKCFLWCSSSLEKRGCDVQASNRSDAKAILLFRRDYLPDVTHPTPFAGQRPCRLVSLVRNAFYSTQVHSRSVGAMCKSPIVPMQRRYCLSDIDYLPGIRIRHCSSVSALAGLFRRFGMISMAEVHSSSVGAMCKPPIGPM